MPTTRFLGGELLRLAEQVWWHGCFRREAPQSAGVGKREAEEAAGRVDARERGHERGAAKKVVTGFSTDLPAFADTNFNSPLIANVASPDITNLWLVGCPAVWGGSPPIAEAQAQLIAFAIKHGIELDELKTIVANAPNYEQTSDTVALGFKVVEFKGYTNFVEYICCMQKYRGREWIIDSQSPYFGSYQIHSY